MSSIRYIPLMGVPMLIYGFIALTAGENIADRLASEVFAATLVSGAVVHVTLGALLLVLAVIFQALEVIRSVRPSNAALAENMVSVILWIAGLIFFLFFRGFGTNEFFIMLLLLLSDYMTGIVVMVFTARRTIGAALN